MPSYFYDCVVVDILINNELLSMHCLEIYKQALYNYYDFLGAGKPKEI